MIFLVHFFFLMILILIWFDYHHNHNNKEEWIRKKNRSEFYCRNLKFILQNETNENLDIIFFSKKFSLFSIQHGRNPKVHIEFTSLENIKIKILWPSNKHTEKNPMANVNSYSGILLLAIQTTSQLTKT